MKEPLFADDLRLRLRRGDPLVVALPGKVLRRAAPDFLKRGLRRSFTIHGIVFLAALLTSFIAPYLESDATKKARLAAKEAHSAIRVDMVDLPTLKLSDLNKIDPMEEVGKPLPSPVVSKEIPNEAEVEQPSPVNAPSETAMIDQTQKNVVVKEKTPPKNAAKAETSVTDRLKLLRQGLRAEGRRKELVAKFKSEGIGGRPALGGNIVSEGDSVTGDLATATEVYNGKVKSHLRKHWEVPGWMTSGRLAARVLVKIAPDGRILEREFLKRSGNAEFDGYVERAVDLSNPFPAPPDHLKRIYMEEGLEWRFPQ
jgi:outer membrane biosynthesis protein TonB